MNPSDNFELLSIDEFCKRLNVGRTTIFKWKKEGALVSGMHFFQKGRIVRYVWSLDVLKEIHEKIDNKQEIAARPKMSIKSKKTNSIKNSTINFEY